MQVIDESFDVKEMIFNAERVSGEENNMVGTLSLSASLCLRHSEMDAPFHLQSQHLYFPRKALSYDQIILSLTNQ